MAELSGATPQSQGTRRVGVSQSAEWEEWGARTRR